MRYEIGIYIQQKEMHGRIMGYDSRRIWLQDIEKEEVEASSRVPTRVKATGLMACGSSQRRISHVSSYIWNIVAEVLVSGLFESIECLKHNRPHNSII